MSFLDSLKSSALVQQLMQWPPTTTTIIGVGILLGWAVFRLTGALDDAVFVAAVFKTICPQDSEATDKALELVKEMPGIGG